MLEEVKLRSGDIMIPVILEHINNRIFFHFGYSAPLIHDIKVAFEGRKYHGYDDTNPRKVWSVPITQRNIFQLEYLKGKYGNNPYSRFNNIDPKIQKMVDEYCDRYRPYTYKHQREGAAHGLTAKQFLLAYDMGTGKTLIAIIIMELSDIARWWWVGPKSALRAVQLDMLKWKSQVVPKFYTYEALKREIKDWAPGEPAPQGLILDESVKVKTPTAQRSVATKHLADSMRQEYENDCVIGLLSGSPAPRSPADWYNQCEIACPGFLKERNINEFRLRLGILEEREQVAGAGKYLHLNTWRDDTHKCAICGQLEDHISHTFMGDNVHGFVSSINEVSKLYTRMKGLVFVKMKKDCLDLPEKVYEVFRVTPSDDIVRAAKLIVRSSRRTIEALTRLRELSDGFQYKEIIEGKETCPTCRGNGTILEYYDPDSPDIIPDDDSINVGMRPIYDAESGDLIGQEPCQYQQRVVTCFNCLGTKQSDKKIRSVIRVECPKDDILKEQLDLHEDCGRLNIYGGFTATIDRIVEICHTCGYGTIRVDGRGWYAQTYKEDEIKLKAVELLQMYAQDFDNYPRVAFIGQAGSAGMGLTLTASPTTMFYSNSFNGDDRIQAEDRGHRIGMSEHGGHIIDIIHLASDEYVLNNLKKKKRLQHLSLTGVEQCFTSLTEKKPLEIT